MGNCYLKQSIFLAVQEGDVARVTMLLEQLGPDGDLGFTQAPQGNTPLHVACICGHIEVTRILLSHGRTRGSDGSDGAATATATGGCDPNVRDAEGRTPLYVAAMGGHLEIVQLLLEGPSAPSRSGATAEVNLRTAAGLNALYAACWRGHRDVALVLLEAGSDLAQVRDAEGRHAWTIAREWNHVQLADEIEAHARKQGLLHTPVTGATLPSNSGTSSDSNCNNGNAPVVASSGNAAAAASHPRAADDGL